MSDDNGRAYQIEPRNKFFDANRSIVEYEMRPGNTVTFPHQADRTEIERIRAHLAATGTLIGPNDQMVRLSPLANLLRDEHLDLGELPEVGDVVRVNLRHRVAEHGRHQLHVEDVPAGDSVLPRESSPAGHQVERHRQQRHARQRKNGIDGATHRPAPALCARSSSARLAAWFGTLWYRA